MNNNITIETATKMVSTKALVRIPGRGRTERVMAAQAACAMLHAWGGRSAADSFMALQHAVAETLKYA